jgi:2-furoyl-CoA dehydrogenase large subunit
VAAADRVAETIRVAAGVILGADPADLELAEGMVRHGADHQRQVAFRHAAGLVHWDPGALPEGSSARLYEEAAFTPPQAKSASADDQINSSLCYGFVAELVVVRIDPVSLTVRVELVSTVHDAGTILNRTLLEGQVHGALAHALGGALYEELRYAESGQPTAATFLDYLCPTSAEAIYPLTSDHLETPSPYTALGAKGCGEGSSMSLPVAIANAVADALAPTGVDITSLPLHGNVVHELLTHNTEGTTA